MFSGEILRQTLSFIVGHPQGEIGGLEVQSSYSDFRVSSKSSGPLIYAASKVKISFKQSRWVETLFSCKVVTQA